MSERPTSRLAMLVSTERSLYDRVQTSLNDEHEHITIGVEELDRLLGSLMGSRFDLANAKADVQELKILNGESLDLVDGLVKLIVALRKGTL